MANSPLLRVHRSGQQTALVVNPQTSEQKTLTDFLSGANYKVLTAKTSDEAIDLCRRYEGGIDLLITDLQAPGISGWELAETASNVQPGIVVLFLSPESTNGEAQYVPGGTAGANIDPFSPDVLVRITRTLSEKCKAHRRQN